MLARPGRVPSRPPVCRHRKCRCTDNSHAYNPRLLQAPHPNFQPMKFRFPIVIIDEDFRSENASGLGIRALASAIEKEGMEVLGVTSYGDLSQFAQQQSRASAFILSIDDEEFGAGSVEETERALKSVRAFVEEIRVKNA